MKFRVDIMPKDWNRMSIQERRRYCKEVWNSAYDPRTDQCVNWVSPDPWKSAEERAKRRMETGEEACFIATAVYGENSYQVNVLKLFRDDYLKMFSLGRLFIRFYYKFSPYTINTIKKYNFLSNFLKTILNLIVNLIDRKII